MSASAADVDGDGTNELVTESWSDGDENGRCVDTTLHVLRRNGSGWQRSDHVVKDAGARARVTGAVIGEFDGRPGADMLADVFESCGPSPDLPDRHHLLALRLADGSTIKDIPSSVEDSGSMAPDAPRIVDVDGDGRDEAVVQGASDIAIIDPSDGWKRLTLGVGQIRPLAVRSSSTATGKAIVAWLTPTDGQDAKVWSARIGRVGGSLAASEPTLAAFPGLSDEALQTVLTRLQFTTGFSGPASASRIDLDRDGCPELILPEVIADCLGTGPIHRGPAWLDTTPLGVVGMASDPRLLVAEGQDWSPSPEGPFPPIPAAATPGTWRDGWSQPFFLDEVSLPLESAAKSIPAPVVGALTDPTGSVDLQGLSAGRLLWRVRPVPKDAVPVARDMSIAAFLRDETLNDEFIFTHRIPLATGAGAGTGSAISTVPFAIADEALATFGNADHWVVSAAVLDARGDVSPVTSQVVVWDQTAPVLTLSDAPFLSPPWPFEARVGGTSEPGARVRMGDEPPVTVDASGTFEIPTRLAPWPQTLNVTATDPSGNVTPATVSVMGGIDVRGMPWPAIAAVAIIIAVALSSLRGTRRVRSISTMAGASEDGGDLVIEELDPGSTFRRD